MANKKESGKARHMMYAQKFSHLAGGTKEEKIKRIVNLIETNMNPAPDRYAVIVHDQEVDADGNAKEPDLHAMMSFANARHYSAVAKELDDEAQYIEGWKGDSNHGYAYLIHATKQARKEGKHLYDVAEVRANFDYAALMVTLMEKSNQRNQAGQSVGWMLDGLYTGSLSKKEIEQQLTGSQYGRYKRQIEDVWSKRLQNMATEWRKQMAEQGRKVEVLWICGSAGTGKTRLAKSYADKVGQAFFLSGSSRDPFQGYQGQHTVILDELRPKVIPFHDLLRITDPFGVGEAVPAPSRYYDKTLACDLIIITTPYSPDEFYYEIFKAYDMVDEYHQLARRISLLIRMTMDEITVYQYDAPKGRFEEIPNAARKNPYSQVYSSNNSANAIDTFNSIFD